MKKLTSLFAIGRKHLMLVLVMYLSLIVPAYCISNAASFLEQAQTMAMSRGAQHSVSMSVPLLSTEVRQKIKEKTEEGITYLSANTSDIVVVPEKMAEVQVVAVDPTFGNQESMDPLQCRMSRDVAQTLGLKTGDTLTLRNKILTIERLEPTRPGRGWIRISYETMREIYPTYYIDQTIEGTDEAVQSVTSDLLWTFPQADTTRSIGAEQEERGAGAFLFQMIGARVFVAIFLSLFAFFHIFLLSTSSLRSNLAEYGVRRAIGGTDIHIFLVVLRDLGINMGLAAILFLFSFTSWMDVLGLRDEVLINPSSLVGIVLIAVVFLLIIVVRFYRKMMRIEIPRLLAGEV